MKKNILLLVATLAISFASCKKDRECVCTGTHVNQSGATTSETATTTFKKISKGEAKTICQNYVEVYSNTSGTNTDTYDCKLK